jgi:hypothetical protein
MKEKYQRPPHENKIILSVNPVDSIVLTWLWSQGKKKPFCNDGYTVKHGHNEFSGVNFINVLRVRFSYESLCKAKTYLEKRLSYVKFARKIDYRKQQNYSNVNIFVVNCHSGPIFSTYFGLYRSEFVIC